MKKLSYENLTEIAKALAMVAVIEILLLGAIAVRLTSFSSTDSTPVLLEQPIQQSKKEL